MRQYSVNVCEWELRCKTITVTARSTGDAMFEAMDRYTPKDEACVIRREGTYSLGGVSRPGRREIEIVQGHVVSRDISLSRLGFIGVKEFDMERIHAALQRL
jgi:hypothetical protein